MRNFANPERLEDGKVSWHGRWRSSAKVVIEIPGDLWPEFKEKCPFFVVKEVHGLLRGSCSRSSMCCETMPQHIQDYTRMDGRKRVDSKKLDMAWPEKILVYAPLSVAVRGPQGGGEGCLPNYGTIN